MRELMLAHKLQPLWIPHISHCQMPRTLSTTPSGFPGKTGRQTPLRALPFTIASSHNPLPHYPERQAQNPHA
eukprot:scaffold174320_cov21-Tisochrysis_lutea.AAC.1